MVALLGAMAVACGSFSNMLDADGKKEFSNVMDMGAIPALNLGEVQPSAAVGMAQNRGVGGPGV